MTSADNCSAIDGADQRWGIGGGMPIKQAPGVRGLAKFVSVHQGSTLTFSLRSQLVTNGKILVAKLIHYRPFAKKTPLKQHGVR